MYDWDDAFVADCEDADKAALMAGLAQQGYQQHGRGARVWVGASVGVGGAGALLMRAGALLMRGSARAWRRCAAAAGKEAWCSAAAAPARRLLRCCPSPTRLLRGTPSPHKHAGFVFVRSRLEKERARPRKAAAGKGFGAGPPAAEKGEHCWGIWVALLCSACGIHGLLRSCRCPASRCAAAAAAGRSSGRCDALQPSAVRTFRARRIRTLRCPLTQPTHPAPPALIPGTLLPNNPQLRLLEWRADYVPGTQLDAMGGIFSAPGGGAALVPDSASLLARSGGSDGGASSSSSSASGGSSSGSAAAGPDPAVLEELQRTMRGQDLSQLRAYVGLPPPGSGAAADGGEGDEAGEEWGMMGVRAYEPEAGEVVVLLAARIGGTPAVGAELLAMESADDGSAVTSLHLPDGWEEALRGDAEGGDGQQPLLA